MEPPLGGWPCSRKASRAILAFDAASVLRLGLLIICSVQHDGAAPPPIKPPVPKPGSTSARAGPACRRQQTPPMNARRDSMATSLQCYGQACAESYRTASIIAPPLGVEPVPRHDRAGERGMVGTVAGLTGAARARRSAWAAYLSRSARISSARLRSISTICFRLASSASRAPTRMASSGSRTVSGVSGLAAVSLLGVAWRTTGTGVPARRCFSVNRQEKRP